VSDFFRNTSSFSATPAKRNRHAVKY